MSATKGCDESPRPRRVASRRVMRLGKLALWVVGCVVVVGWPFVLGSPFVIGIGALVGMFAVLALSMNLMIRMGQLSFMHGALMGIGAYGAALLMMRLHVPFLVAFLCSGVIGALFALVVGPILLRVKGVYFALLTFAVGQVIVLIFIQWVGLFGGAQGLFGVPPASLFGFPLHERWAYYLFAVAIAALSLLGVRWLYRSEIGAVIDGLDSDEGLAQSLGVNILGYRLLVFVISGFLAGIAGGFYASYYSFVTPDGFTFWTDVDAIVMNVLGGITAPLGPILGALVLVPLPELLRSFHGYEILVYGLVLIGCLLFLPDGFVGLYHRLRKGKQRA